MPGDNGSRAQALKERVIAEGGTVLESVSGEVTLADTDAEGRPRRGPVLVLGSIEEGSQLTLSRPRAVIVLGALSGRVFGAYRVKAGHLLSGRLEGARHVEVLHAMGSPGNSNVDAWIVFDPMSDPDFFRPAEAGLRQLRQLDKAQAPQRESTARQILLRTLADFAFDVRITVPTPAGEAPAFFLRPTRGGHEVVHDAAALARVLLQRAPVHKAKDFTAALETLKTALRDRILLCLQRANQGGLGSALRKRQGTDVYTVCAEAIFEYLFPKVMRCWMRLVQNSVQRTIDQLCEAPMVLRVDGQLAPFFQIEYPRWRFGIVDGEIRREKVADCNIACQLGEAPDSMRLTYNYVGDDDWVSRTIELPLEQTRHCKLILKNGSVFLSDESRCLFSPDMGSDDAQEADEVAVAEERA